jgi:hypothetical protein
LAPIAATGVVRLEAVRADAHAPLAEGEHHVAFPPEAFWIFLRRSFFPVGSMVRADVFGVNDLLTLLSVSSPLCSIPGCGNCAATRDSSPVRTEH